MMDVAPVFQKKNCACPQYGGEARTSERRKKNYYQQLLSDIGRVLSVMRLIFIFETKWPLLIETRVKTTNIIRNSVRTNKVVEMLYQINLPDMCVVAQSQHFLWK